MAEVDAVELVRNAGLAGGQIARVHVVGEGWMSVGALAVFIGESNAELAELRRDLDRWSEETPFWLADLPT